MKKIFTTRILSLMCLVFALGFTSNAFAGDGTQANPYTVAEGISNQNATPYVVGWVKGYIVGAVVSDNTVNTIDDPSDVVWGTTGIRATSVLIADDPSVKDYNQCVIVNLPTTAGIRGAVNLVDNPGNLGKVFLFNGTLRTYFGIAGHRDITAYAEDGGPQPAEGILNAPFKTGFDGFTAESVAGDQVWLHDATNGYVKMTGYVGGLNNVNEDWLISPSMNLTDYNNVVLTFDHTGRMFDGKPTMKEDLTLWVSSNYVSGAPSTASWTQVTIPTYMTGDDWVFVSSGDISLASLQGQANARIAFKFVSTATYSGNWEIKNVLVDGEKVSGINDINANELKVYSTPGYVNVETDGTEYITIYNVLGSQVAKVKAVSGVNEIPVQSGQVLVVKVGNKASKVVSK